jgi:homoserine trans-succinylase
VKAEFEYKRNKGRNTMDVHGVYRHHKETKEITYLKSYDDWVPEKRNALKTDDEEAKALVRAFHAAEVLKRDKWEFSFYEFLHDEDDKKE